MMLTLFMTFYLFCIVISTISYCTAWKQRNSTLIVLNGLALLMMLFFFLWNLPEWIQINF